MSKIYDSFLFFNEIDILHIRLELLYPFVDNFIISECDTTFSGNPKPFYYEENKHLFEKYADKIIYIKNTNTLDISDIPVEIRESAVVDYGAPHWCREWLQREYVKKGMINCKDDDIIVFGDLDEIPDPIIFTLIDTNPICLKQRNMIYYINKEQSENWYGNQIAPYSYFKERTLNSIRGERQTFNIIENGWHLSYMGGSDRVKSKIRSYGHQEYNNNYILDAVSSKIENGQDVLCRNISIFEYDTSQYPNNMMNLVDDKYSYLLK